MKTLMLGNPIATVTNDWKMFHEDLVFGIRKDLGIGNLSAFYTETEDGEFGVCFKFSYTNAGTYTVLTYEQAKHHEDLDYSLFLHLPPHGIHTGIEFHKHIAEAVARLQAIALLVDLPTHV